MARLGCYVVTRTGCPRVGHTLVEAMAGVGSDSCWCVARRLAQPRIALQLLGYSFTLWVISTMLHPESLTTRVLEWHPLRFLGRLSYSLYVWQVLFYSKNSPAQVDSHLLLTLSERPWKYVATACAALLSYYLIEKPMIRLGNRLAPPATEGRGDLQVSAMPAGEAAVAGTA